MGLGQVRPFAGPLYWASFPVSPAPAAPPAAAGSRVA